MIQTRTTRSTRALFAIAASALTAFPALAAPKHDEDLKPARPSLFAESAALVAGATNSIAVSFYIEPGWHTYWPGQNDTGFAPTIDLTLPEGWTAGEPQWPAPHRHISPGDILDHIYENTSTIIIPITIPADAQPGPATISADLEWLVCKEACIPGWQTVTLETSVIPQTARPRPSPQAVVFLNARARFAKPFPKTHSESSENKPLPDPGIKLEWSKGVLIITATQGNKHITFAPHNTGSPIQDLINAGESKTGTLRLQRSDKTKPIRGVVEVSTKRGKNFPILIQIDTKPLAN